MDLSRSFFFQLIDYGLFGFVSYLLLFLFAFIYFFRRRKSSYGQTGFLVTVSFFIFACLSGEIGGNNTYAYMLIGYCMGACRVEEDDETEEDSEKKKKSAEKKVNLCEADV